MFKIEEDKTIRITRGDTGFFSVEMVAEIDGIPRKILLDTGDKITFSVKRNEYESEALIKKILTKENQDEEGEIKIKIESSDTENLDFDRYRYDIQATLVKEGVVDTFICPANFIVLEEITF